MIKITVQNFFIFDKVLKYKNNLFYHRLFAIGYFFIFSFYSLLIGLLYLTSVQGKKSIII